MIDVKVYLSTDVRKVIQRIDEYLSDSVIFACESTEVIPDFSNWLSRGDLGFDLKNAEPIKMMTNDICVIRSGVKVFYPENCEYGLFIYPRSSLPLKMGLTLANNVGVIDPQYRGDINLLIHVMDPRRLAKYCISNRSNCIPPGTRIAQGVFLNSLKPNIDIPRYEKSIIKQIIVLVDKETYNNWSKICPSDRGNGGFGSTGV